MSDPSPACAICGQQRGLGRWLLVAEHKWEDKLRILEWNDWLAGEPGLYPACGSAHALELVMHWMVTGSLGNPGTQVSLGTDISINRYSNGLGQPGSAVCRQIKQVGELSVHRESLRRALHETPNCLKGILAALMEAIQGANMEESPEEAAHSLFYDNRAFLFPPEL